MCMRLPQHAWLTCHELLLTAVTHFTLNHLPSRILILPADAPYAGVGSAQHLSRAGSHCSPAAASTNFTQRPDVSQLEKQQCWVQLRVEQVALCQSTTYQLRCSCTLLSNRAMSNVCLVLSGCKATRCSPTSGQLLVHVDSVLLLLLSSVPQHQMGLRWWECCA